MRIGILGGTFDPPHWGHWHLAEAARDQLTLDKILWVPTASPPHKQQQPLSPIADRLAMVEAMVAASPQPGHEISRVDIDRPGPHWAADTVACLAQQFPGQPLVFLMGSDSLRDLPTWGRPLEFLAHCSLGVLRRPNETIDLAKLERRLPGVTAKVEFIQATPLEIASHTLRQRVREGKSIKDLVPEAVAQIIQDRHLYQ